MAAASTEERELRLVDNVELRILNVATDEKKLQPLLDKYLAPLLLKVTSEHVAVRAKVIKAFQNLQGFIKPRGYVVRGE